MRTAPAHVCSYSPSPPPSHPIIIIIIIAAVAGGTCWLSELACDVVCKQVHKPLLRTITTTTAAATCPCLRRATQTLPTYYYSITTTPNTSAAICVRAERVPATGSDGSEWLKVLTAINLNNPTNSPQMIVTDTRRHTQTRTNTAYEGCSNKST